MNPPNAAQRRFPRIPSVNALLVKKRDSAAGEDFARTRVVGLGGCMFVAEEPVGVGAHLDLLISIRGRVAKTVGRVVYEVSKGWRRIEVGVEFLAIAPHDREVIQTLFRAS
jgi:hypothetical protein